MINRIEQMVEYVVGVFLSLFWRHVETNVNKEIKKTVADTNVLPTAVRIPVIGNVPLDTFKDIATNIIPAVVQGLKEGKAPEQIVADLKKVAAPTLISVTEAIVGLMFPEVGTIISLLTWMINNSKVMTQEETNAWMDRQGAGSQS